ncbi:MAG: hydrogen gas-evolving membrane-bound hydrogenase subunit E [Candidatus Omnitrophota bacterium]
MIELHLILILMIAGAIVAMEIENLLSSVIALGAVGIGLSLAFLLLKAPDLAITQLVVEILSVIILIKATVGLNLPQINKKPQPAYLILAGLFVMAFLYFSAKALIQLPACGEAIMKMGSLYVSEAVKRTGATNIVSAVMLDFRGYDTLGEVTILFTSVIGVLAVLRKKGRR